MTGKNTKKRKIRIPVIRLRYRILSYVVFIAAAILCAVQLMTGFLPQAAGIALYGTAGTAMCAVCVFIVPDVKNINRYMKRQFVAFKEKYAAVRRFFEDYRFRNFVFTAWGLLINTAFAVFNGVIGVMSGSVWYVTLAAYYLLLTVMRFWVVNNERYAALPQRRQKKTRSRERIEVKALAAYRNSSVCIIFMTLTLSGMVVLTIDSFGGRSYPGMTIYVMALYTFIKVPIAVRNWIKARRENTAYLMTIRSITFADACVSVMSLQTAMFASFGQKGAEYEKIMNGVTGGIVCILVLAMGIYGVYSACHMKNKLMDEQEAGA